MLLGVLVGLFVLVSGLLIWLYRATAPDRGYQAPDLRRAGDNPSPTQAEAFSRAHGDNAWMLPPSGGGSF